MEGFNRITVSADDGVQLAVYDRPHANPAAPVLFLCNGLGGNLITWRHQLRHFEATHRIATWDYRGLYASALAPADVARGVAIDIPRHAQDALCVLDALRIERAVFVGWSMGVQLNFELVRHIPGRIAGLIQIAGSHGRSLSTTLLGRPGERLILPAMGVMKVVNRYAGGLIERAVGNERAIKAAARLGVVAPSLDRGLAQELVRAYVRLDFDVYNRILASLGDHDAWDVLPTLAQPVLIIAGDRDPMTPKALSRKMAAAIPDAELVVVPRGSHYVPVEFPERINTAIAGWLARKLPDLAR